MSDKGKIITDSDIEKAFNELEKEADLMKAENEEEIEEVENEEEVEEVENEEDVEDEEDDEDEEEVEDEEEEKNVNEDIQKGIEVSGFLKGIVEEFTESNTETKKVMANSAIILKGVIDQMGVMTEQMEVMANQIDQLSGVPRAAKSRIKGDQVKDKFEKAEGNDFDGDKVVGLRSGKNQISQVLDELAFGEGKNEVVPEFAKALMSFEATHSLTASVAKAIEERGGFKIDATK